jgi:tetratricopeptide (TPR) repeat protein
MNSAPDTIGEGYSRKQVLRMLGLSDRQLTSWERQGLVSPRSETRPETGTEAQPDTGAYAGPLPSSSKPSTAGEPLPGNVYTFSDLVSLRTLLQLRKEGVPPARIRSLHAALKEKLGGVERPWSELQVQKRGKQLLVHFEGAPLEPLTGQLLLEYSPKDQAKTVRKLERPARAEEQDETDTKVLADRFFRAGLRYEEQKDTLQKAARAYEKAVELDPHAAGAWINLGTVFYNLGKLDDAERCYRAVLEFDAKHALAHFNLANVFDERRQWEKARRHYEEAIRLSPNSPDPHYNLALVYDKLGLHGRARLQWIKYLKHDPHSQWAVFARQQLEKTAWQLVSRSEPSSGSD